MLKDQVQTALRVLFPPSCAGCGASVDNDFGLCGSCWREVPLISGPICDSCGVPVLSDDVHRTEICDDCVRIARPWSQGRAALRYADRGRQLVLALKHGDRQDIGRMAATLMANVAQPLLRDDTIIVPVPLHWSRLVKRRYNQSAVLAQHLAFRVERRAVLDGLIRTEKTAPLEGVSVDARFERLSGVITANPRRADLLSGKPILIVDDVMTSGATLAAATEATLAIGAARCDVLTLARVCKAD